MGFFDWILNRNKGLPDKRDPNLACELEIGGKKYMLEEFDINFDSSSGDRYIPLYAVFGGDISPELESWITRSSKRMDGRVRFYLNNDKLDQGAIFSAAFYDAVCVKMRKSSLGETPLTTLVLSAKGIKLGNEEYRIKD